MDAALPLVIGLIVGALVGAACAWAVFLIRSKSRADAANPALVEARHQHELQSLRVEESAARSELQADLARMEATAEHLNAQVVQLTREREQRAQRDKSENALLQAIAPVRQSLQDMQRTVAQLEEQRQKQHGELSQQLRTAVESDEHLRKTTDSLAAALSNNSVRGVWGETQLRSVVEAAGLIERVDFDVQTSISSDIGAGRPDMVVHLPGGKSIAVDSKVPMGSYLEASAIPVTATGEEGARREKLLTAHVKAVRDHISALGGKAYWDGLDASPELVIAFIPSESLVSSALEADPALMEYAFGKRVALASPVTLWSVLKTVAFSWQQELVTAEAKQLFDLSRELYSRLSTMAGHIDKLGRSVRATVSDYNRFVGSLERTVLPSARKLNKVDESKIIPPIDEVEEAPRELAAYELVAELDTESRSA
ncbi:DNA recombination protein RmuC [Paramicrobacterium agarici]|uniref:DNA recombination protein RmuC n=1 Tax=Paramicrobacterium agarici TaxID=630514 RepID=UPI0011503B77|nr:DNA recombination protein RmuC [Microbacterium agarici]TQO21633.1 DNA recombination protein RmuC [Microbacterium agarici]